MTDLQKLSVSLTKHGAHKVALLFDKYNSQEILDHLWGSEPGIKIDEAQAKKNLSVGKNGVVPDLWDRARNQGTDTVYALVLIAIIFSHYDLITAMSQCDDAHPFIGTIIRGKQLHDKAYTNFAHIVDELGFCTEHSDNHFKFNLESIFHIKGLNKLAVELLGLKLKAARWDGSNSVIDEVIDNDLEDVFSITKDQFRNWLTTGKLSPLTKSQLPPDDLDFFAGINTERTNGGFNFKPGHNKKKTGKITVSTSKEDRTADLLHNEMQTKLHHILVAQYGEAFVGTEVPTGYGTSIDVVVKTTKTCKFYEIKTADSAKACIRQAIPQLLEYAYWHGAADLADELIIVSPHKITTDAKRYIEFLNSEFNLPIQYEQLIA